MLLTTSSYSGPSSLLFNGHLQTIVPGIFRKVEGVNYIRERLELEDGDFLDLDWIKKSTKKLVILSHGLEGNSSRQYMLGAAKYFSDRNWSVLSWNCRSCSEEINRKFKLYYHGDIHDFSEVVDHCMLTHNYTQICLVGYSMGGSILSKYLGVKANNVSSSILGGISYSAPCDLRESIKAVEQKSNWLYKKSFRSKLDKKIRAKHKQFPTQLDITHLNKISAWEEFDRLYSLPLNGFNNLDEFYENGSCKNFIHSVKVPLLIVNALNDPIIPNTCINYEMIKRHRYVDVEYPSKGGHVGFSTTSISDSWMETRAEEFINKLLA